MKHLSKHIKDTLSAQPNLMEMSNYSGSSTGLGNIWIWVGEKPGKHGYRVKVSNLSNKPGLMSKSDSFSVTLPQYNIVGTVNTKLVTSKNMAKLMDFIRSNEQLIKDLSDLKIDSKMFSDRMLTVSK